MNEFILLTDSEDPAVAAAAAKLDSWLAARVPAASLVSSLGDVSGVRALLIVTNDPSILRAAVERAHALSVPVIVGCADDAARRRAIELRAEEWFGLPGDADEIAGRIWAAVARGSA